MLKIKNLSKKINGNFIFNKLNLDVADGKKVAILGPSGVGKSTFLRCVADLDSYEGKIFFSGKKTFVFQDFNLFPHLTIWENISYVPLKVLNKDIKIIGKDIALLCDAFSFDEALLEKYPRFLSGGQQQRAAIMRGILSGSSLLILDEPSSALDSETTELVAKFLKNMPQTILFATHDVFFAKILADITYKFLETGVLVENTETKE